MFNQVVIQMGFWTAWLVIPAIFELSPAIVAFFRNHFSKISSKQEYHPGRMPQLTVIVPIYNSGDTLYDCLKSIAESNYPKHLISIICANNKSTDNSFEVYKQAQMDFRNVRMQWLEANQGKAKALILPFMGVQGIMFLLLIVMVLFPKMHYLIWLLTSINIQKLWHKRGQS